MLGAQPVEVFGKFSPARTLFPLVNINYLPTSATAGGKIMTTNRAHGSGGEETEISTRDVSIGKSLPPLLLMLMLMLSCQRVSKWPDDWEVGCRSTSSTQFVILDDYSGKMRC